jgi:hypothetical protein
MTSARDTSVNAARGAAAMRNSTWGLVIGLVLGPVWAFGGFGHFVLAGVVALVGYLIGKALQGELDLRQLQNFVRRDQ